MISTDKFKIDQSKIDFEKMARICKGRRELENSCDWCEYGDTICWNLDAEGIDALVDFILKILDKGEDKNG